jgi:hypothetical protein
VLHRAEGDQGPVTERLTAIMAQAVRDAAPTPRDLPAANSF